MQFKIQLVAVDQNVTENIIVLDRSSNGAGVVGMSLSESKQLLKRIQQVIVSQQADHYTQTHRKCPHCNRKRRIKDTHNIQYRTLFGIIPVPNLRLWHCRCEEQVTRTFSVLNSWCNALTYSRAFPLNHPALIQAIIRPFP